jgi:hypothetical protein
VAVGERLEAGGDLEEPYGDLKVEEISVPKPRRDEVLVIGDGQVVSGVRCYRV